ncbi:hypothetical protein SISSUDRAFT_1049616 [Sistotremastrum suecicum HHB10207 ss-3]|uniref:Uncharacterized protein n=1 Tax=Sistotremastrum suecicum HHB10207 ss-3 TaxID=1314776 RepID=A0A166BRL1_9AGAM|nr:hypothetical protein SISSUDRAFT_1049616 [Sistotremastrum suecicum HHB10207 ss-3]
MPPTSLVDLPNTLLPWAQAAGSQPQIICCIGDEDQRVQLLSVLLDVPTQCGPILRSWCTVEYHLSRSLEADKPFSGSIESSGPGLSAWKTVANFESPAQMGSQLQKTQEHILPGDAKYNEGTCAAHLRVNIHATRAANIVIKDTPDSARTWDESRMVAHLEAGMILWSVCTDDRHDLVQENQPWMAICACVDPLRKRTITTFVPPVSHEDQRYSENLITLLRSDTPPFHLGLGLHILLPHSHPVRHQGDLGEDHYWGTVEPWSSLPDHSKLGLTRLLQRIQVLHTNNVGYPDSGSESEAEEQPASSNVPEGAESIRPAMPLEKPKPKPKPSSSLNALRFFRSTQGVSGRSTTSKHTK